MKKICVPYIDQTGGGAFTGCESVTAVMFLQYLGCKLSIYDFIDNYLEKEDFVEKDGVLYGPNPYEKFVGNPYKEDAMGCYAPVIQKAMQEILGDKYLVLDETGRDLPYLIHTYVDNDMPVALWATIDLRDIIVGPSWKLTGSGKDFTWLSNEHCMLLVGYDEEHYIFNDPWNNNGVIAYDKATVEDRFVKQHKQAVSVVRL